MFNDDVFLKTEMQTTCGLLQQGLATLHQYQIMQLVMAHKIYQTNKRYKAFICQMTCTEQCA